MQPDNDPRVYFAAERTLLAWLRTGIAIIGLGFLVARFGLFLAMFRNVPPGQHHVGVATFIGTGFVLAGSLIIAISAWQQRRFMRTLRPNDLPADYWTGFSLVISVLLALLGASLGIYLIRSEL